MAMVISNRMSRRDFVKGGLAAFGAAVIAGGCSSPDSRVMSGEPLSVRWAFLSDVPYPGRCQQ